MNDTRYSAFSGSRLIASGDLRTVLGGVKGFAEASAEPYLIFDHSNGRQVDFDLRGSLDEALARVQAGPGSAPSEAAAGASATTAAGGGAAGAGSAKAGKGRPRLGVVAGEVTLLPRHWEWLAAQPLKASGTLRRLVDEARAKDAHDPRKRIEALGTLLWSLAGNLPRFEDASRALYSGDRDGFLAIASEWPGDLGPFCRDWLAT